MVGSGSRRGVGMGNQLNRIYQQGNHGLSHRANQIGSSRSRRGMRTEFFSFFPVSVHDGSIGSGGRPDGLKFAAVF